MSTDIHPELVALIDLVGSAQSGSAELDAEIWKVISAGPSHRWGWYGICPATALSNFTRSIDAARQLVPRPAGSMSLATTFAVGGFADERPRSAWAKVYHDCSMAGSPVDRAPFEAKDRPSPALALCEAALRALNGEQPTKWLT